MVELRIAVRISDVFAAEAWLRVGAPVIAGLGYLLSRWLR